MLIAGLWFGGFQALMPLIGFFLGTLFASAIEAVDHWVAFGLLGLIGFNMLKEAFEREEEGCDCNNNDADLSVKTMFVMAVATSIDALAVGISFACVGIAGLNEMVYPLLVITLVSGVLSLLGYAVGVGFGKRFRLPVEPLGGLILIAIGCRILYEHLMG